jgi:pimeloyl-ACP methyl ester carboxylesterase
MEQRQFKCMGPRGFHQVNYTKWGKASAQHALICIHGLTRNGRDFDILSEHLEDTHHVYCVDLPGRGKSEWMSDPMDYAFPLYMKTATTLITQTRQLQVDWLGTSMGGIMGMLLAAQFISPIRKLVLNDVGPFVSKESLGQLGDYVGKKVAFDTMLEMENYLRDVHQDWGYLSDEQWAHMTSHSHRYDEDGKITFHYDPDIRIPAKAKEPEDVDLWHIWDMIKCPVLVLRGERSKMLSEETAEEMMLRGPEVTMYEIPDVGHAPALMEENQIRIIHEWLNE